MTRPPSSAGAPPQRLDQALVARGLFPSRSRARDAILRGTVTVERQAASKPGTLVPADAEIVVDDPAQGYVSRAALKLKAGLDAFGFDPADRTALDIGASTGGFTEVLIEGGASHVVAVDVGHGQMHPRIAADPRVTNLENRNARDLAREDIGGRTIGCVVCDVSFIPLRLALPPALSLTASGAFAVVLVKPQFEAGPAAIGKGGLLRDPALGEQIAEDLACWLETQPGWRALGIKPSPIAGGDGNREYLLGGLKT